MTVPMPSGGWQPTHPAPPEQAGNAFAVAGLVAAVVGFFVFYLFVPSLAAVVLGAKGRSRAAAGRAGHVGWAWAAIALGLLEIAGGVALWVVVVRHHGDCPHELPHRTCRTGS